MDRSHALDMRRWVVAGCLLIALGCNRNPSPFGTSAYPPNGYGGTMPPAGAPYNPAPYAGAPAGSPALPPTSGGLPAVPALPPTGATSSGNMQMPNWSNPGTIAQQQAAATYHDPYADNTAAPEIVGGRPREFSKPAAEPVRSRGFRNTRFPF